MGRDGQPITMSASDEDSVVQSLHMKLKRRLTRKDKRKKKLSGHDNLVGMSNQSESDGAIRNDGGPKELNKNSVRRALKIGNERLCRSTRHRNPVIHRGTMCT